MITNEMAGKLLQNKLDLAAAQREMRRVEGERRLLFRLAKSAGATEREIAKLLGISQPMVNHVATGRQH